jgi:hypothetical protein
MLKLDLHIHSKYSEDAIGSPKEIIKSVKKKGLNGIAITDHNTIKGGLAGAKLSNKDFVVIPGIEISTSDGHLIALNIKKDVPKGLSVEETVDKIIDLGGTPIVPHLFRTMSGIKEDKLKDMINKISTIEIFNSCSIPKSNYKMSKTAKKYNLGGTGGSDSHMPEYCGLGYTTINDGELSIDNIISCIEKKKTWGQGTTLPLSYRRYRMIKSINQFFQRGLKRI